MHPQYTTIYLVGHGQVLTIDTGEESERYRWMLKGYLAATEKAEIAISGVSHHHRDHTANLRWLRDEFQSEIYIASETKPLLQDAPPDSDIHLITQEQEIEVSGGLRVQVLFTPGHSVDSVCYYLEDDGVLFTGDTILGASTTTIIELRQYMQTLERLKALPNLKIICPGHGPIIYDPYDVIHDYIRRRLVREQEIIDMLAEGEPLTSWTMVEKLYTDVDKRLWRAADRVVQTHLRKLEEDGRIIVHPGKPKPPSGPAPEAQEEEHRRLEIIRQADEYRTQARRGAEVSMDPGAASEWIEPPAFEIIR